MISRRDFLSECGATLAGLALTPAALPAVPKASTAKRVLVLGAGAAGLCAAYELERAGHDVTVFEAKAIPGGRLHTLRAPFADGLYAEAGATYLASNDLAVQYAREFGLPLTEVALSRPDLGAVAHIDDQRILMLPGQPVQWPVALKPNETGKTLGELQRQYHYAPIAALRGLDTAHRPDAHSHDDTLSLAEFWRKNGASEGAIRLMRLRSFHLYGDGIESVSTLQLLREDEFLAGSTAAYQIQGGNDLLARAFTARLGTDIRYGWSVRALRHDEHSVEVTVEEPFATHFIRGDYAICTLPFPVLRDIPITPPFPELRARAIREIQPTSVTRVYVQCRHRFWESFRLDGSAVTDLPIQQVSHATAAQPGIRGILEAYTCGERARHLGAMSESDRLEQVCREMEKVHPSILRYVEGGASYSWDSDPWARGAAAWFKPGQVREFFPYLQQPEGRIHFAGDTIGGLPGYLQSAMLSARAAVDRIAKEP